MYLRFQFLTRLSPIFVHEFELVNDKHAQCHEMTRVCHYHCLHHRGGSWVRAKANKRRRSSVYSRVAALNENSQHVLTLNARRQTEGHNVIKTLSIALEEMHVYNGITVSIFQSRNIPTNTSRKRPNRPTTKRQRSYGISLQNSHCSGET